MQDVTKPHRRLTAGITLNAIFSLTMLASCGGSDPGGVGSGGTGTTTTGAVATGNVTGFGSVFIEGIRYDDSNALLFMERDPASPTSATSADMRLGMQADLGFSSGTTNTEKASKITVSAEVIGAVYRPSTTTQALQVAGQTILVESSGPLATVLDGIDDVAQLKSGDQVEVHGYRDANEQVRATRLELLDVDQAVITRVHGRVSAKLSDNQWQIGGLRVNASASTGFLPSTYRPSLGENITVYAKAAGITDSQTITASSIVQSKKELSDNEAWRVAGMVRSIDRAAQRFKLGRHDVDATALSITSPASMAEVSVGDVVRVNGSALNNVVKATSITVLKDATLPDLEITGSIGDYVPGTRARIRDSLLSLDGNPILIGGGSERLGTGTLVKASGKLVAGRLKVSRLEIIDLEDARTSAVHGKVSLLTQATASSPLAFNLDGVRVQLTLVAALRFADGQAASPSNLAPGIELQALGAYVNGKFIATTIVIKDNVAPQGKVKGLITQLDLSAKRATIDGTQVTWNSNTEIDGTLNAQALRRIGEAEGRIISGVLVATKLKIGK